MPMPTFPECGLGGTCPLDYDPVGEWNFASGIPSGAVNIPEDQRPLGSGMWVDRAWNRTVGDPRVAIAVLDSGIRWHSGNMLNKFRLNALELPLPQDAAGVPATSHDRNGDGVFNMEDWSEDPRLSPELGENPQGGSDGVLDPSDLIALFSDGIDDDGNGYVDDICGWDFFWDDNNPYDDTLFDGYSHGTSEARMLGAEGNDGDGAIGTCPNCMVLPLRVSDSFIADVNNFAMATLYAADNGAQVVESALGTLNNSQLSLDAVRYANERGVSVIASAADECSYHNNLPSVNEGAVYVHAIRYDEDEINDSHTFLAFSNGTNYGPRLQLSASGTAASSEAAARTAGITGLLYSAALQSALDPPLSANEVYQVLTRSVDDVRHNPDGEWPDQYPSRPGWDRYFGYGRLNAKMAVDAVLDRQIPPEADITSPLWFTPVDPREVPVLTVEGVVDARRASSFTWSLQVAPGMDPQEDSFEAVAEGEGTSRISGPLGTIDLAAVPVDPSAAIDPIFASDTNVQQADKAFIHAVTLRVQVRDDQDRLGEFRKLIYLRADPDELPGMPRRMGPSFEASVKVVDVDGDELDDLLLITSDGAVHVTDARGDDKPGWPQRFPPIEELDGVAPDHQGQEAFTSGSVATTQAHAAIATPAVGDLDGDGTNEVVAATLNGAVFAWHSDGTLVSGWPFWLDRTLVEGLTDEENRWDYGFFASPALGDLDGDGTLEVVLGAMDGHVYVLRHDGTAVPGFPVLLREEFDTPDGPRSIGERIISSPALGDLDADGGLDIVIGTNQKTTGTYGLAYALRGDGTFLPGWPLALFGAYTGALPYVGEGVPGCPTVCDIDGDGDLEIAVHTIADSGNLYDHDGQRWGRLARIAADFGPASNTGETAAAVIMINSGAWGDLDGDGRSDYMIGSLGLEYAAGALDDGHVHNHDHLLSAWSAAAEGEGEDRKLPFLRGFPQVMEDFQFFLNPIVADLDGDGAAEVINGSAGHILHAFDRDGAEPAGWPKDLGNWILGSPAVGDADHDGYLDVWATTRGGLLFGWRTTALASEAYRGWASFRNDPRNTGNCAAPLRSYPPLPPVEEPDGCDCGSDGGGAALLALLLPFSSRRRRAVASRPAGPASRR
jgi:hypothetical protein